MLLLIVQCQLVLSKVTEYCVKPNNTLYHSQSCHTLQYYMDPLKDYFKLNNTVFNFLPGEHVVTQPLIFKNVENITLQAPNFQDENVYLKMLPTFSCGESMACIEFPDVYSWSTIIDVPEVCCSILQMTSMTNGIISGLTVVTAENGASGIIVQNSKDIQIKSSFMYFYNGLSVNVATAAGIVIINSSSILIDSVEVMETAYGIMLLRVSTATVINVQVMNCSRIGFFALQVSYSNFTNLVAMDNNHTGLHMSQVDTVMFQQIQSVSNYVGVTLLYPVDTIMEDISAQNNHEDGIDIAFGYNTLIRNISAHQNGINGIDIGVCDYTTIEM